MPINDLETRTLEVGRIRLGAKSDRGAPIRLDAFRLTSQDELALKVAAELWGGTVQPWTSAPDAGTFEVYTEATTLPVVLVAADPVSQWLELWAGPEIERRCDGEAEQLGGGACICAKEIEDGTAKDRRCRPRTRVNLLLPDLPGLGTWLLASSGAFAARTIPATVGLIADLSAGPLAPATLAIVQKSSKAEDGQTRRYSVPVFSLRQSISELTSEQIQTPIEGSAADRVLALAADLDVIPDGDTVTDAEKFQDMLDMSDAKNSGPVRGDPGPTEPVGQARRQATSPDDLDF